MVITWRELLIIVAVVGAVYIAEMLLLLRSKRGIRRWKPEKESETAALPARIELLESDVSILRAEVLSLREQLERSPPAQPEEIPANSPYSQAIQLARQGMDIGEVAANCGISRGEAELIVAMHRSKSR